MANTLIIKNIPHSLSEKQTEDLLKHFGAESVRCLGKLGPMKHCAFAKFGSEISARLGLNQLHQLNVLDFRLRVEYAANDKDCDTPESGSSIARKAADQQTQEDDVRCGEGSNEKYGVNRLLNDANLLSTNERNATEQINPKLAYLSKAWGIQYNIETSQSYSYPPPSYTTLQNIIHCMASVPKFYTQVLHLMNKMNLPAPFGELTTTPPLKAEKLTEPSLTLKSSDEESELESSDETEKVNVNNKQKALKKKRPREVLHSDAYAKRLKLKLQIDKPSGTQSACIPAAEQKSSSTIQDVFEVVREQAKQKRLDLPTNVTLNTAQAHQEDAQIAGSFGKIATSVSHQQKPIEANTESNNQNAESEGDANTEFTSDQKFITAKELRDGRMIESERDSHPILKKYVAGEPCVRLYIKNLAKQTTEAELKYIFGRYIDWNDPAETEIFSIRHMTEGRMKGQAFITLPHLDAANAAVSECHTYTLNDRPMSVSFAKSK